MPNPSATLDLIQAMHGYNPFLADAFGTAGDPGFMNGKIFYAQCKDIKNNYGYRDFISVRNDLKCESSMASKTFSSLSDYQGARSGSFSFGRSYDELYTGFG